MNHQTQQQFIRAHKAVQCCYLNSNKVIFQDEQDSELYYWYDCPFPALFYHGQPDTVDGLQPISKLSDHDQAAVQELLILNAQLEPFGLAAVCLIPNSEQDGELLFVRKTHPDTYFLCPVKVLSCFNPENTASLSCYLDPRPIHAPYCIQELEESTILAY